MISAFGALAQASFGPFEPTEALRKAVELRDHGYRHIVLTDVATNRQFDIEAFMEDFESKSDLPTGGSD